MPPKNAAPDAVVDAVPDIALAVAEVLKPVSNPFLVSDKPYPLDRMVCHLCVDDLIIKKFHIEGKEDIMQENTVHGKFVNVVLVSAPIFLCKKACKILNPGLYGVLSKETMPFAREFFQTGVRLQYCTVNEVGIRRHLRIDKIAPNRTFMLMKSLKQHPVSVFTDKFMHNGAVHEHNFVPETAFIDVDYRLKNKPDGPTCFRIKPAKFTRVRLIVGDAVLVLMRLFAMAHIFLLDELDAIRLSRHLGGVIEARANQDDRVLSMEHGCIWYLKGGNYIQLSDADHVVVPDNRIGVLVCSYDVPARGQKRPLEDGDSEAGSRPFRIVML